MKFSYLGRKHPRNLQSMFVSADIFGEYPWFVGSGANQHFAADATNFDAFTFTHYVGTENIATVGGEGMSILSHGSTSILTPNHTFYLHNILHLPKAPYNLISVHKFAKDNHWSLNFSSTHFSVKNLNSWRIIFQGPSENELYHFTSHSTPTHVTVLSCIKVSFEVWDHLSYESFNKLCKSINLDNVLSKPLLCIAC